MVFSIWKRNDLKTRKRLKGFSLSRFSIFPEKITTWQHLVTWLNFLRFMAFCLLLQVKKNIVQNDIVSVISFKMAVYGVLTKRAKNTFKKIVQSLALCYQVKNFSCKFIFRINMAIVQKPINFEMVFCCAENRLLAFWYGF